MFYLVDHLIQLAICFPPNQSGNLEAPTTMVMEKQKVIIAELREKLNLPLDNLNKLSNDELKSAVDNAICQVSN